MKNWNLRTKRLNRIQEAQITRPKNGKEALGSRSRLSNLSPCWLFFTIRWCSLELHCQVGLDGQVAKKASCCDPVDPISKIGLPASFRLACNIKMSKKGVAMWVLSFYVKESLANALNSLHVHRKPIRPIFHLSAKWTTLPQVAAILFKINQFSSKKICHEPCPSHIWCRHTQIHAAS